MKKDDRRRRITENFVLRGASCIPRRSEPIEKLAHDGCRVQTLLLVKECIIPCASHGERSEQPEKAAQGRLLCRPEPNAGKRRMKPGAEIRRKKSRSLNFPSPKKASDT